MNARQKAKHFKKLYEETLVYLHTKPFPVVYKVPAVTRHYKISHRIFSRDIDCTCESPEVLKTFIENKLLQEFRQLIWGNIKIEKDPCSDYYTYSLDIWVDPDDVSVGNLKDMYFYR